MSVVIRAQGLGKLYHIGAMRGAGSLYDRVARGLGMRRGVSAAADPTIWALRDISFDVSQGEIVGVLGRNGSGKTTLMKILARITSPTTGMAEVTGRVGTILQVGTGFHPELSGRDNIYLSGAILGMNRTEIARLQDEIVDFAEIGAFLDTPVKHYSSGMHVRLAFSVTAHMRADIMLIDEALAVGDLAFQKKCQERIRQGVVAGRTVVLVSHSLASIRELCTSAIVLDKGALVYGGRTDGAIDFYQRGVLGMAPEA